MRPAALLLLFAYAASGQNGPDTTLIMEFENTVWYVDDTGDSTKNATVTSKMPAPPADFIWAYKDYVLIGDLITMAGKPVRGTFVTRGLAMNTSNADAPVPGRPIADFPRSQMHYFCIEVLTPERAQVGTLFGFFMGSGSAQPGMPRGLGVFAVVGGSGAYVGIRGQGANIGFTNGRITSTREDPAFRRVNGGGLLRLEFHLSGASLPQVTAAYHGSDYSPVTSSNPARPGELVILAVKTAWPVVPYLEPGKTFAQDPLQQVAIPVGVAINDTAAEIVNTIGWPGTRDMYRVDVRLPGTMAGDASMLTVSGAYLTGPAYAIPVR